MCETNLCRTSSQYQSSTGVTSAWRRFQNRFCLYQWLLMRLHNVSSLGRKQLSEFFITLHLLSLVILMTVFVLRRNRIRPRLDPLWTFLRTRSDVGPTTASPSHECFQIDHLWTCEVFVVRYSQSIPSSMSWSEKSVTFLQEYQRLIANWLYNALFRCMRPWPYDPILAWTSDPNFPM